MVFSTMSTLPYLLLSTLFVIRADGETRVASSLVAEQVSHATENVVKEASLNQLPQRAQRLQRSTTEAALTLKVQVRDFTSHQYLQQALVEVYVNRSLTNSALTADTGTVLLKVPYALGLALTIVTSKTGYILRALSWKTQRMPMFSSVTSSLYSQTQGDIWLFEDSVLLTGRVSDALSQPKVQFSKNLLSVPGGNITSLTAYMTVPQFPMERDYLHHAMGILITNSNGSRSTELSPVVAICVQLCSNGGQVQVTGHVKIILPLPVNSGLRVFDIVPAWSFDRKTGAWVTQGLGVVKMKGGRLVWTFVAPHLGSWIAAPFPSFTGHIGHSTTLDLLSFHSYPLMATLGGSLVIVAGLITVLLCYSRGCVLQQQSLSATKMEVLKKDQATCTTSNSYQDVPAQREHSFHSIVSWGSFVREQPGHLKLKGNLNMHVTDRKHQAVRLYGNIRCLVSESSLSSLYSLYGNSSRIVKETQSGVPLNENVFLSERFIQMYNPPVAVLNAPNFFSMSEQQPGSGSASHPREGVTYNNQAKPTGKNSFIQTQFKAPLISETQQQVDENPQGFEDHQCLEACSYHSNLAESVSAPESFSKSIHMSPLCNDQQGISEARPLPPACAWFVSLDGKPAARVHHSITDLQKVLLPNENNDITQYCGIAMSESPSGKKLKRDRTFVRTLAPSRALNTEDVELSSSESGTTVACTPEDPALRTMLGSSCGTIPNIPEEGEESTHPASRWTAGLDPLLHHPHSGRPQTKTSWTNRRMAIALEKKDA